MPDPQTPIELRLRTMQKMELPRAEYRGSMLDERGVMRCDWRCFVHDLPTISYVERAYESGHPAPCPVCVTEATAAIARDEARAGAENHAAALCEAMAPVLAKLTSIEEILRSLRESITSTPDGRLRVESKS